MRLINADDVFPWYVTAFAGKIEPDETRFSMYDIEGNLMNIPTVDAVPVVRCKDCTHVCVSAYLVHDNSEQEPAGYMCSHWKRPTSPDGFCDQGYWECDPQLIKQREQMRADVEEYVRRHEDEPGELDE